MKSQITTLLIEFLTSKRNATKLVTNSQKWKRPQREWLCCWFQPASDQYGFDDPSDQIAILNKLVTDCIADHAPIRKVKFTCTPAPWMKDQELVTAKKDLEHLRSLKNANGTDGNELSDYQNSKARYKKLIKSTKRSFLRTALSSKKTKEV